MDLKAGTGIFASVNIKKGEYICSFGGALIDSAVAQYVDPTYILSYEIGRGFKL